MTTLRERVDDATTRNVKWNGWPDKMELVGVTEVDQSDPVAMMDFGFRLGMAEEYRQVDLKEVPPQVRSWLTQHKLAYSLIDIRIGYADMRGQVDARETRNVHLLISPGRGYDWKNQRSTFETPGLIVEVGCEHEYETIASGNCWQQARCTRCGHEWEVDSSG